MVLFYLFSFDNLTLPVLVQLYYAPHNSKFVNINARFGIAASDFRCVLKHEEEKFLLFEYTRFQIERMRTVTADSCLKYDT